MAEKIHVRCGKLFQGTEEKVLENHTIVAEDGIVASIAPTKDVPKLADAKEYDFSRSFVIPGLIDVHTHLAYGNAKTEEDIDLYSSLEFRAVRGVFFAHQVLASGFTTIVAAGDSGMVSRAVRDAIDARLFEGPRVTAAGPYITSREGLTDWYPTWIGVPTTSIGRLVRNRDEAIEEIRKQVKEGVDAVKIAMDGIHRRPNGELVAAFTLEETRAIDDEGLEAAVANKCAICPTLTLLRNTMDFIEPQDPAFRERRNSVYNAEFDAAVENLQKVRRAGVPMPIGTDSGFAVTPFGEWHARELEIFVDYLGFTPIQALKAAT